MLTVCHIVEEVYMVTVGSQCDGESCPPGFHQCPCDLVGIFGRRYILAVCAQLQLHVLIHARRGCIIVAAVEVKCDGSSGLQGLTEVQTEAGPAVVCVAYLQGVAAAVFGSCNACIGIGCSFNGSILRRTSAGEEQLVALGLEIDSLSEIAGGFRFLSRFNCLEVIHIDLKICRTGLVPAVHIAHQVNILTVLCQHDGQIVPAIVVVLVCCAVITGINQIGFSGNALKDGNRNSFRIGSILAVCLEADYGAGLKRLTKADTENRPLAICTGDLQGIIAVKGNDLKGSISPGVVAAYRTKPHLVAGGLEIDSLQEIAGGLDRLDGDHIINVYRTGGTGNNTCAVIVPEQIHIGRGLR